MHRTKRILCLLLCAALLLSMSTVCLAATYSSWFQSNYDEIQKLGLMPPSFETLDLTQNITRGEMCELAVYAFEKATGNGLDLENETFKGFLDTSDTNIIKAHLYGIVDGYEDGTFRPDRANTRAETMTLVNRVLGRDTIKLDSLLKDMKKWPDNADASKWFYLAVQEATNAHDSEMKNGVETWTQLTGK